jgi:hypothetical protein
VSCILIAVSDGRANFSADITEVNEVSAQRNVRPTPNVSLRLVYEMSSGSRPEAYSVTVLWIAF